MLKTSTPSILPRISRRSRPVACSRSVGTVPGLAPGPMRSSAVLTSVHTKPIVSRPSFHSPRPGSSAVLNPDPTSQEVRCRPGPRRQWTDVRSSPGTHDATTTTPNHKNDKTKKKTFVPLRPLILGCSGTSLPGKPRASAAARRVRRPIGAGGGRGGRRASRGARARHFGAGELSARWEFSGGRGRRLTAHGRGGQAATQQGGDGGAARHGHGRALQEHRRCRRRRRLRLSTLGGVAEGREGRVGWMGEAGFAGFEKWSDLGQGWSTRCRAMRGLCRFRIRAHVILHVDPMSLTDWSTSTARKSRRLDCKMVNFCPRVLLFLN